MATPWYQYKITQEYGQNGEQGVDLGTPFHTPVTALFAGRVNFAGRTAWRSGGSSGGMVCIVCTVPGKGVHTSYYLHLDTATVKVNDTVQQGQIIGLSGGQLSGGQWPVVNTAQTTFSTGPHTEFGFNADWVPGPGTRFDPTPYILAAKGGTLPLSLPDGSSTAAIPTAQGASPATQVWTPTLVENLIAGAAKMEAVSHKVVTEPTGWDGICQDIDYQEQFPPFEWRNPFGSIWLDLPPLVIRGVFLLLGLFIIYMVIVDWIRAPFQQMLTRAAGGSGNPFNRGTAPDSAAGGAEGAVDASGEALAEAPIAAAV